MRPKYARGPALKGSCKLPPAEATVLALLIREHGHGGAAARLKVSPALVDKLADGGPALPDSVRRMTEALHRGEEKQMRAGDVAALIAPVLEEMQVEMNRQSIGEKVMGKKVAKKVGNPGGVMKAVEKVIDILDEVSSPSSMSKLEYQELLEELAGAIEARLDCVNNELKEDAG